MSVRHHDFTIERRFRHRAGAFLDTLEDPADREHGTGLLLDRLEALLGAEVLA